MPSIFTTVSPPRASTSFFHSSYRKAIEPLATPILSTFINRKAASFFPKTLTSSFKTSQITTVTAATARRHVRGTSNKPNPGNLRVVAMVFGLIALSTLMTFAQAAPTSFLPPMVASSNESTTTNSVMMEEEVPLMPMESNDASVVEMTLSSYSLASKKTIQPLQIQLETKSTNIWGLTFLPSTVNPVDGTPSEAGSNLPSFDFHYINYYPAYHAGQSKIDFWMHTPAGVFPPQFASLELYDEYGQLFLKTIVPAGTAIPQDLAKTHKPFLWTTWTIPATVESEYDFSNKFRVVLRTSDNAPLSKSEQKQHKQLLKLPASKPLKRWIDIAHDFVTSIREQLDQASQDGILSLAAVPKALKKGAIYKPTGPRVKSTFNAGHLRDRQFNIMGLRAIPGGKPHPFKVAVNPMEAIPRPAANPATVVKTVPQESDSNKMPTAAKDHNPADDSVSVVGASAGTPTPVSLAMPSIPLMSLSLVVIVGTSVMMLIMTVV